MQEVSIHIRLLVYIHMRLLHVYMCIHTCTYT